VTAIMAAAVVAIGQRQAAGGEQGQGEHQAVQGLHRGSSGRAD